MSLINETFDIKKLNEKFNFFFKFCDENANEVNILLKKNCEIIYQTVQNVVEVAFEFTFENIPLNGFFIYLIFVDKFFEKTNKKLEQLKHTNFRFFKLFKTVLNYSENINFKLKSLKNDNSIQKIYFDFVITRNFYELYNQEDEGISLLYGSYVGFWLDESTKNTLSLLSFLKTLKTTFPFSINCLWNSEKRGIKSFSIIKKCNLRTPFDDWHITNNLSYKLFFKTFFLFNRKVNYTKIKVPRQKRFKIYYKSEILDLEKDSTTSLNGYLNDEEVINRENTIKIRHKNLETIECPFFRLNSSKNSETSVKEGKIFPAYTATRNEISNSDEHLENEIENTLVINLHGGGFFIRTPDEFVLRYFTSKLKGIPILSINYSLTMPYPVSLQEVLDVYLWLVSGNQEVIDNIGFHPKKIILMSDSAGGLLGVQLILFLNDLNKKLKKHDEHIFLPKAYLGLYPCFNLYDFTPSKLVTIYDNMIPLHAVLLLGSKFLLNITTDKEFNENANKNDKSVYSDKKPWFDCEYETFKERMQKLYELSDNKYINVFKYDDYESLKNITIDISVGQFDIFLDDCIEFSKIWKGKVTLNVLEGMVHGFHYLFLLNKNIKKATEFCCQRLQIICGLT